MFRDGGQARLDETDAYALEVLELLEGAYRVIEALQVPGSRRDCTVAEFEIDQDADAVRVDEQDVQEAVVEIIAVCPGDFDIDFAENLCRLFGDEFVELPTAKTQ